MAHTLVKIEAATIASMLVICGSVPTRADMGSFFGGVVGGMIGQSLQQQQPQPYYQQPYYQPQQPAYDAEAHRQYVARQAELKKKAQEKKDAEAAAAAAPPPMPNAGASAVGPFDVAMKRKDGNLWVPAQINNVVTIDFVVDSGASDITLPKDVYQTLIRSGTLTKANYLGQTQFGIGDGSQVAGIKFKLSSLQVGNQVLHDVVASVMPSDSATPLLGLSFLSRFQSWTIDNNSGTLRLTPLPGSDPAASTPVQTAAATSQGQAAPTIAPLPDPPAPAAGMGGSQTPTLKVAANEGPRSGRVSNSALIVTDGNAPATADATRPETSPAVPIFPANTTYADARTSLLALGYGPAPLPDAGKCDADTDTTCFPERLACTKSDGLQCNFIWKRGDQVIKVKTVALPPMVSQVDCQVNCK